MSSLRNATHAKTFPKTTGAGIANLRSPLHMADGGQVSPWSLRGMGQNLQRMMTPAPKTPEQLQQEQDLADYKTRAAAERAAQATPVGAAPSTPILSAAPMGSQSVLDRRMRAAGLRDGGELRTGMGGEVVDNRKGASPHKDTVPARYADGEFVVSNDMLDAEPSLRGKLHSLRAEVLAEKGITPEQADAKALRGGAVHALTGGPEEVTLIGRKDGQDQAAVAGAGPTNTGGATGSWGVRSDAQPPTNTGSSGDSLRGFMPGTRAVMSGFADDAASALREPEAHAKVGQFVRSLYNATLATPAALAHDVLRPVIGDNPGGSLTSLGRGIANTVVTAATGDSTPRFTASTPEPTAPAVPQAQPAQPTTEPTAPTTPSLRGVQGTATSVPGAFRFDTPGQSPMFTDAAGAASMSAQPYRPAMSADDPGMQGIQARQDLRMNSLRLQKQYDDEVAAANAINARYQPKEGFMRMKARMDREAGLRQDDTMRRGQDMDYGAKLRSNELAWANHQREQKNKDRDFAAGRTDAAFSQRQAAQKAMDERIDARFTDPATGKTDPMLATQYKQFVNNGIADEMERLAASKNPDDRAKAAKLKGLTYADLDPADLAALEQSWQVRDATRQKSGWLPGTGHFVESLRPKDWAVRGVDTRSVGGDHLVFNNGSHISKNDLTGRTLGIMPQTTNMFEPTLRAADERSKKGH